MQVVTHEVVADVEAAVQLFAGISEAQCKTILLTGLYFLRKIEI